MNTHEVAAALFRDLPGSLAVHPHRIDLLRDAVAFIRLDPAVREQASFLDERVAGREVPSAAFEWRHVEQALSGTRPANPAHYVFHVGHCGSTLLSRLLGELGVAQLREPQVLRTLAEVHVGLSTPESRWSDATFAGRLALVASLFDRGHEPRMVKATSSCSDLLEPILGGSAARRATLVYTPLSAYLANVLAGPNSRLDVLQMAPLRIRRLGARLGAPVGRLHEMSAGVVAAMSWVAETTALSAAVDALGPARALCVNFDRFLGDVPAGLQQLAAHVPGAATDAATLARVASSPMLTRYSKAPEHAYDASLRQAVLDDARRQFGDDIRAGLEWASRLAEAHSAVARALARFDQA